MYENLTNTRIRKWCLTVFNTQGREYTKQSLCDILTTSETHYICIGEELTPTTSEIHFHIYVEYVNAKSFEQIKKLIPSAHIEIARGSANQNKIYISKVDSNVLEYGKPTTQRLCSEDVANSLINVMFETGESLINIAISYPQFSDYIIKNFTNLSKIEMQIKMLNHGSNNFLDNNSNDNETDLEPVQLVLKDLPFID